MDSLSKFVCCALIFRVGSGVLCLSAGFQFLTPIGSFVFMCCRFWGGMLECVCVLRCLFCMFKYVSGAALVDFWSCLEGVGGVWECALGFVCGWDFDVDNYDFQY